MKDRMKYWVIADTHFGHARMLEPDVGRPGGYECRILDSLENRVRESDILIHLGDICIGNDEIWHRVLTERCAGRRWLVRGNHDRKSNTWYMEHGWDFVGERVHLNLYGLDVCLTHRPAPDSNFDVNVHGHQHKTMHHLNEPTSEKHVLVYCEDVYAPRTLRSVLGR